VSLPGFSGQSSCPPFEFNEGGGYWIPLSQE